MSEETRPLADLPPADRTLLAKAPLELAVAEIRFVQGTAEVQPDLALDLRQRLADLGHRFARFEPAQQGQVSILLQPGTVPTPQVQTVSNGWQLMTADGRVQVTILPSAVVVQTSSYERWSVSLRPLLEALLKATGDLLKPSFVSRIGLRYIDRFVDPQAATAAYWHGRIHEQLLGPMCHPVFGARVLAAQQQVELELGEGKGALMRHGPFVDAGAGGAVSYLLDVDVFDSGPMTFDPTALVERAEVLNRTAASLFQAALTPVYLRTLQQPGARDLAEGAQEAAV